VTHAQRALAAVRRLMVGLEGYRAADRALTFHMLEHLAPRFFRQERLADERDRALAELEQVSGDFPVELDEDEAMARLDALYLRKVRGLALKRFDEPGLARWIRERVDEHPVHAWLMQLLAGELGLSLPPPLPTRYPFRQLAPVAHFYMLTHEVMVDTRYYARPFTLAGGAWVLDELAQALPKVIAEREWDITAEIAFTLRFCGRPAPGALEALQAAQRPDGTVLEGASEREQAHAAATSLLVFAQR